MAANGKQKLKLIYLMQILQEQTDPEQGLSMPQIIERLGELGIPAERKSLYRDIETLRLAGLDIQTLPTRPVQYVLVRSELGIDDVMMLVDIVQSSRFITERKSNQLVKSLKSLVSARERKLLNQRVHVEGRIKSLSESVFHSVDTIHEALQSNRKIEFLYFSFGTNFRRRPRHAGKRYEVTPIKVVYADGNYYLAAYDDAAGAVRTYRVDRMELLQVSDAVATRNEAIAAYDYEDFAHQSFGMFHGEPACVTLRVQAQLIDTIVDRFGLDVDVLEHDKTHADIRVNVRVSPQFFGWVAGLDGGVVIQAPAHVANDYRAWLKSLIASL